MADRSASAASASTQGLFEDFPLKQRRHFAHGASMDASLAPLGGQALLPHTLQRQRIAHDAAEQYMDPDNPLSVTQKAAAADSPWQSSYQAACAQEQTQKKRGGKRMVHVPGSGAGQKQLLVGGGVTLSSTMGGGSNLMLGTTRESPHVSGYTGHIPQSSTPQDSLTVRNPLEKTLIIDNYKPFGPGYTGRLGR